MNQVTASTQLKKVQRVSEGIKVLFQVGMALWGLGLVLTLAALVLSSSFQLNIGNGNLHTVNTQAEQTQSRIHLQEFEKVWGLSLRSDSAASVADQLEIQPTPVVRAGIAVMLILNALVIFNLLQQLTTLFGLYAKGEIFTQAVVNRIRRIGFALLGFPVMSALNSVVAMALVAQLAPGSHFVDVSVNFGTILAAVVVLMISWIMDVGRTLREENELVI